MTFILWLNYAGAPIIKALSDFYFAAALLTNGFPNPGSLF
jgi:hypothetical protein